MGNQKNTPLNTEAHKITGDEEERQKLSTRLNLATRAAQMGIWDWDIQKNELVWDEQMYRLYGLEPGDFGGAYEAWLNGVHPDDRASSNEESQQAVRGEKEYDTEFRVLWPDGSIHWLKANGQVFRDEKGNPLRMVGVNYDITRRKQAQEQLHQSEERFSKAFQSTPTALVLTRLSDSKFEFVNDSFLRLVEYQLDEVIDKSPAELNLFPNPAELAEVREMLLKTGKVRNLETSIRSKGGEIRYVTFSVDIIQLTGKPYSLTTMMDITERKRIEEDLKKRTEELEQLLEMLPSAIWIAEDPECKIIRGNRYANELLSVTQNDNVSQSSETSAVRLRQFSKGKELAPDELPMQTAVRTGEAQVDFELLIERSDKIARTLIGGAVPLFDAVGKPRGAVAGFYDITDLKRTEDELRRSNAELEQFAYIASHDLQEPLRTLAGMVQLLQKRYQGQLDDRADEYIAHAVESADRMQALIKDLLAYSRVDRRNQPIEAVSAQDCLRISLKNLDASIRASHATVMAEALPIVHADSTQLIQLFQNLIGNSIKFRGEREPRIQVTATRQNDAWQFAVSDNGIGIEAQYFERIFLVFQRLHTRRQYQGTGIGLALCKKIVERHGGSIRVESRPGEGSTFYFTLPIRSTP